VWLGAENRLNTFELLGAGAEQTPANHLEFQFHGTDGAADPMGDLGIRITLEFPAGDGLKLGGKFTQSELELFDHRQVLVWLGCGTVDTFEGGLGPGWR